MRTEVIFIICYIVYNLFCYLVSKAWAEEVLKEYEHMEFEE
ncbi:hypothetical protein [Anaerococcus cruorum]|uniref:Transcriptional regulator n=1 Tax=Anaerococcus cruorum TaxID=3115617 RepID=A0ABW9MW91_9FIRM